VRCQRCRAGIPCLAEDYEGVVMAVVQTMVEGSKILVGDRAKDQGREGTGHWRAGAGLGWMTGGGYGMHWGACTWNKGVCENPVSASRRKTL
jgi:hypothetical protein